MCLQRTVVYNGTVNEEGLFLFDNDIILHFDMKYTAKVALSNIAGEYNVISINICKYGFIDMHGRIHTYIHAYIHTYIHTYIHAYIHTYMHTYIHTCIHTVDCVYNDT